MESPDTEVITELSEAWISKILLQQDIEEKVSDYFCTVLIT